MRRGEEDHVDSGIFHPLPREALEREAAIARQLRIGFAQIGDAAALAVAAHQHRLLRSAVPRQQAHQLEAGISGGAEDRGLESGVH